VKKELRERIIAFNKRRAEADEKAEDLMVLLNALPPGLRMLLLRDKACAAILNKYGIAE